MEVNLYLIFVLIFFFRGDSKSGSRLKSPSKKGGESSSAKKKVESPTKKVVEVESPTTDTKVDPPGGQNEIKLESSPGHTKLVEENVMVEDTDVAGGEEAEGAEGGASWSGWFTSTMASAKERSTEMLQYLKQDLSEFSETVSEAGRDLKDKLKLEENAKTAANVVGERMNVVLEQMSNIFGVGPDDDDEAVIVGRSGPMLVDRVQVSKSNRVSLGLQLLTNKSCVSLLLLGKNIFFGFGGDSIPE